MYTFTLVYMILARERITAEKKNLLLIYIFISLQTSIMPAYIHWKNNNILKQPQSHDFKHCLIPLVSTHVNFNLSSYFKDETYKNRLLSVFCGKQCMV